MKDVKLHIQVHEVTVNPNVISPDPVSVNINDVVAWTFKGLRQNDIERVRNIQDVMDIQAGGKIVTPRSVIINITAFMHLKMISNTQLS